MNKWDKRFMELTEQVATWSSCHKDNRQVGAIIVKNKRILTTGYNGAPRATSFATPFTPSRTPLSKPRG